MNKTIKIILLGHGSSLSFARENFKKLKNLVAKKYPAYEIDFAFMTEGKKAIHEKIYSNLPNDIKKIIIVPVFLSHGIHTKMDIPKMLEFDSNNLKNINYQGRNIRLIYTEPLGIDSRIANIVMDRIQAAINL